VWRGKAQVQVVSIIEKDQKGDMPCKGKSTLRRQEEAGAPRKRKSTGKKAKESRRGKSDAPYKGKGTARGVEKEFMGDIKEEG